MVNTGELRPARVLVVGGGISGLTAAHELAERGFDVTVYDRNAELGGKARSFYLNGGSHAAEHGFRFFLRWYENLHHTLARIPGKEAGQTVFEHLTAVDELTIDDYSFSFVKPEPVPIRPPVAWIKAMSSCKARHEGELGDTNWDDYVEQSLQGESETVVHFFKNMAKATASVHSTEVSVRAMSYSINRLLVNPGLDILEGPTNDTWFDYWERHLRSLGVVIHQDVTVEKIRHDGEQITGLELTQHGTSFTEEADYYVLAIPHANLEALLPEAMVAKDPMLQKLPALESDWQTGLQLYLKQPMDMPRGHLGFCSSPWSISCIQQTDFWDERFDSEDYGAILSLIIADWDAPGIEVRKPAKHCTKAELIEEVEAQLRAYAPEAYAASFAQMEVLHSEVDPGVHLTGDDQSYNETPLFMNKVASWHNRPTNETAITNLYIAGDFTRTSAYVATMESANESGRRAANAVLRDAQYSGAPCEIFTEKHDKVTRMLQPLVQMDELLFAEGKPHMFDLVEPDLIEAFIDTLMPFMQFEGSLQNTLDEAYGAAMDLLQDFSSKHGGLDLLPLLLGGQGLEGSSRVMKERLAERVREWSRVDMTMVDKMPLSFPSNLGTYLDTEDPIFDPLLYTTEKKGSGHRVKFAMAINAWLDVATDQMAHLLETGQCIHNCSLLIDDVMDDTDVRRTQASAHVQFGTNQALGAAYTSFFQILLSTYLNLGEGCLLAYLEESARAHVGQSHDVYFREKGQCPSEDAYLAMVSNKTGSFFRVFAACLLELSPRAVSSDIHDTVLRFSDNIGVFFQVRDDYLDLTSEAYFAKKGGMASDFDEGKFSYPVVHCIGEHPDTYDVFMEVFAKADKTDEDKRRLLAVLEEHGSLDYTLRRLEALFADVVEDLGRLEQALGRQNEAMRTWVGELAQGIAGFTRPGAMPAAILKPVTSERDPFDLDTLPLDSIRRALRNVLCSYHVYYQGNGWSRDEFWQCFPLLLTVEAMIFNVDDANELGAENDAPAITRESVERSKVWTLIRSSGFYSDEMTEIYERALDYYRHEFEWYRGEAGDSARLEQMNHLKSTNYRIMHLLSANVLERPSAAEDYGDLEDYVSLRIEQAECPQDTTDGVYNILRHCRQLFGEGAEQVYREQLDRLASRLSPEQRARADKWLEVYGKSSRVPADATAVDVSFQKIYAKAREIAEGCRADPALADFTLEGNFKWCVDKFQAQRKNPLSSDAIFRRLQNDLLAKMSGRKAPGVGEVDRRGATVQAMPARPPAVPGPRVSPVPTAVGRC
ncbi:MAG: FAD-dependent oxidoreductase [Myxococcota bacterium]